MPRTKQRRTKVTNYGFQNIVRDFHQLVQIKIREIELDYKSMIQKFDSSVQLVLSRYPLEIQNLTLAELLTIDVEESPKKENLRPKTPRVQRETKVNTTQKKTRSTNNKRVTGVSDDGYQSESAQSQASKLTAGPKRRSRSVSTDRKSKLNLGSAQKKSKKDLMKTPTCKTANSFVITPKVKLNSAINVLRKPKDGEMVFSTQGSPLLVSTTVNDKTANINVPLRNGNIVSLLPFNESSLTENLHLDDETKHQLKILQSHLAKVLN